jgi:hypothetical protein
MVWRCNINPFTGIHVIPDLCLFFPLINIGAIFMEGQIGEIRPHLKKILILSKK